MLKNLAMLIPAVGLAIMLTAGAAGEAQASSSSHKPCAHLGYCKPGTCADNGSNLACNIKNCKKKNCAH